MFRLVLAVFVVLVLIGVSGCHSSPFGGNGFAGMGGCKSCSSHAASSIPSPRGR